MNAPQINPAFWIRAIRTNAHVTDCAEKTQALRNAADHLEQYIAALAAPKEAGADRMAPVQGWPAGIPWALHMEAYAAYCKKWSPQKALIEGGCRGGFGVEELDEFIPGWRDRISERTALLTRIAELTASLAAPSKAAGAEGDEVERIGAVLFRDWNPLNRNEGGPFEYYRARIREAIASIRNPPGDQRQEGVAVVRISKPDRLDPITIYLADEGGGRGRMTIVCYNQAWTCYWGAMGTRSLREFVAGCDASYVAGNMLSGRSLADHERDYAERIAAAVIAGLAERSAQA